MCTSTCLIVMLLVTSDVASCVSCYYCLQLAPHGAWGAWDNYNANGTTPLTSKTYSARMTTPTTNAAQSTVSTWGELECTMLTHNEMQQEYNALFYCNHINLKHTMVMTYQHILQVAQNPEHHAHTQFYECRV